MQSKLPELWSEECSCKPHLGDENTTVVCVMVDILQLCADGWQVLSDRVELARGNRAPIGLMVAHEIVFGKAVQS